MLCDARAGAAADAVADGLATAFEVVALAAVELEVVELEVVELEVADEDELVLDAALDVEDVGTGAFAAVSPEPPQAVRLSAATTQVAAATVVERVGVRKFNMSPMTYGSPATDARDRCRLRRAVRSRTGPRKCPGIRPHVTGRPRCVTTGLTHQP
ncbi:hypothetical protein GCM10027599_26270 [Yimella radicis]